MIIIVSSGSGRSSSEGARAAFDFVLWITVLPTGMGHSYPQYKPLGLDNQKIIRVWSSQLMPSSRCIVLDLPERAVPIAGVA